MCLLRCIRYHGHAARVVGVAKASPVGEDLSLILVDAISSRSTKVVKFKYEHNSDGCDNCLMWKVKGKR